MGISVLSGKTSLAIGRWAYPVRPDLIRPTHSTSQNGRIWDVFWHHSCGTLKVSVRLPHVLLRCNVVNYDVGRSILRWSAARCCILCFGVSLCPCVFVPREARIFSLQLPLRTRGKMRPEGRRSAHCSDLQSCTQDDAGLGQKMINRRVLSVQDGGEGGTMSERAFDSAVDDTFDGP